MAGRRTPPAAAIVAPLAAPVIWAVCFLAVYLFAEAACAAGGLRWAGADAVVVVTLAAAGLALAATAGAVVWSRRARGADGAGEAVAEQQRMLSLVGVMLAVLFAAAIVALAVPALVLRPC